MPLLTEKSIIREHYAQLKQTLLPHLKGHTVVHLDIPCHMNIGDLLIDAGTSHFLADNNINCAARLSLHEFSHLKRYSKSNDVIFLLHGGGNFGDLFPRHQEYRKAVVQAYKNNHIIALPQSAHYKDKKFFISDSKIFNAHPKLLICARDNKTHDYMSSYIDREKLCLLPDMASSLVDTIKTKKPSCDKTLYFRRRDQESAGIESDHNNFSLENSFDWEDVITEQDEKQMRRCHRTMKKSRYRIRTRFAHKSHIQLRDKLTQKAINHFQQFSTIDSDRLHGIILAQLLQIPTIVHDNIYGKSSNYVNTWLSK